jgi:hypothetical protein
MADVPRLMLLIAVASLAIEAARLALEWSPSHPLHHPVRERIPDGRHDAPALPADAGQNSLAQTGLRPPAPFGAQRPCPDRRVFIVLPYERPPPDYYRPGRVVPWCPDCRRPLWRYERWSDGRWRWVYYEAR